MIPHWQKLKWPGLILLAGLLSGPVPASDGDHPQEADGGVPPGENIPGLVIYAAPPGTSLADLKRLSPGALEMLFARADAGTFPVGLTRARVYYLDERCPRLQARLAGLVWKGKNFREDGFFINRWVGVEALSSVIGPGESWYDGRPCLVMEYPPGTPLFAHTRDELREIAPGLWLGRLYEFKGGPRFRGYFALQLEPERHRRFGR